jgi:energy-converting hydrogenase A subunit M
MADLVLTDKNFEEEVLNRLAEEIGIEVEK